MTGLLDFGHDAGRRKLGGVIDLDDFAGGGGDAIAHAGRGGDEVDAKFALEAFLHDLHVQQAEEAAAKAEAERDGIFRLVEKCGVVQLQFAQGVAQIFVVAGLHGKQAGENHGLDGFKSGQRGRGARGVGDGVAHARVGHALDVGDDEADVAGCEFVEHDRLGRERAEGLDFIDLLVGAQADFLAHGQASLHYAHQNDRSAVGIEPGIENQGLQRRIGRAARRRNAVDGGLQHLFDAEAALGADEQRVGGGNGQDVFNLRFHFVGLRGRQVDLVDHRNDGEIVFCGQERIGDGLRFDALAGVHDQQGAFAGREGAGDFVGKIDVAGRVDQVELIFLAVGGAVLQADALGLDGDAALALEVHGVEDLRVHLALAERAGKLEQAVGQRGLAVVDVRDNAKVAYEAWVHCLRRALRRVRTRCLERAASTARTGMFWLFRCEVLRDLRSGARSGHNSLPQGGSSGQRGES